MLEARILAIPLSKSSNHGLSPGARNSNLFGSCSYCLLFQLSHLLHYGFLDIFCDLGNVCLLGYISCFWLPTEGFFLGVCPDRINEEEAVLHDHLVRLRYEWDFWLVLLAKVGQWNAGRQEASLKHAGQGISKSDAGVTCSSILHRLGAILHHFLAAVLAFWKKDALALLLVGGTAGASSDAVTPIAAAAAAVGTAARVGILVEELLFGMASGTGALGPELLLPVEMRRRLFPLLVPVDDDGDDEALAGGTWRLNLVIMAVSI